MRTLAPLVTSALLLAASGALAQEAPLVVSARVVSYERAELLQRKVCALVGIADVGGHARLFDIAVDGKRCSPPEEERDSVPLRVRIEPEVNGFHNVVFEADVPPGTSAREMDAAVDGAARELFASLGTTRQPPPADGYVTPTIVPYVGGGIPADATIVTKPNTPLIGAGAGLFAASYAGALIYALSTCSAQESCRQGSGFLYIPIVGPFITMATAPTTGGAALAGFDGGVQVLGAALTLVGFLAPKKFVVWQSKSAAVSVMPTTMGAGASAGVAVTVSNF